MGIIFCVVILLVITINLLVFTITSNTEKEYVSLFVAILLISSICATWLLISVAPKSDSVATQVINDFRNNKYEIYKTEIINSDTTYYYRLKQKEQWNYLLYASLFYSPLAEFIFRIKELMNFTIWFQEKLFMKLQILFLQNQNVKLLKNI